MNRTPTLAGKVTAMREDFLQAITSENCARPISLTASTRPRVTKDCPYQNLIKVSSIQGMVRADYEKAVNKVLSQTDITDKFSADLPKWGQPTENKALIRKDNNLYLRVMVTKVNDVNYFDGDTLLDPADIQPYLIEPKETIPVRNYKLSHIKRVSYNGNQYQIS